MSDHDEVLPSTADARVPVDGERIPRRRVWAWALWDWATQPFNTVIITFVFVALYLTKDGFIDPEIAALGETSPPVKAALSDLASDFGLGMTVAGILVALVAPVLGQRADATGRRKAWLGVMTALVVACTLGLFFVQPSPDHFWLGAGLIALGGVFGEIAGVNYNAMIVQVTTPRSMGRVSGLGWGLGYLGGIVALVIVVVLTELDWFGMDTSNGMAFRVIALGCAAWTLLFAWPLFAFVPESKAAAGRPRVGIIQGYAVLWRDLGDLWRTARSTLWFLLASAVYRDGLAGVFTFGAILATQAFDFGDSSVMVFGIAASAIAGVATIIAGRFDDWLGPRRVILFSLGGIVLAGLAVLVFNAAGAIVFWVAGLILTAFVGPAQSASRSLLARVAPAGREAEVFGLYATTGRAASFLAPLAWWASIELLGATIWGTLGIIAVVGAGMALLLFVRTPADSGARV